LRLTIASTSASPRDEAVTSAVSARLRSETAGNPLYATQLLRHWTKSGRLVLDAGVELVDDQLAAEVPAGLRNLL